MTSISVPQYQRVKCSLPLTDSRGQPLTQNKSYPTVMYDVQFTHNVPNVSSDDVFSWYLDSEFGPVYTVFVIPKRQNAQISVVMEAFVPGANGTRLTQVKDTVLITVVQNGIAQPVATAVIG